MDLRRSVYSYITSVASSCLDSKDHLFAMGDWNAALLSTDRDRELYSYDKLHQEWCGRSSLQPLDLPSGPSKRPRTFFRSDEHCTMSSRIDDILALVPTGVSIETRISNTIDMTGSTDHRALHVTCPHQLSNLPSLPPPKPNFEPWTPSIQLPLQKEEGEKAREAVRVAIPEINTLKSELLEIKERIISALRDTSQSALITSSHIRRLKVEQPNAFPTKREVDELGAKLVQLQSLALEIFLATCTNTKRPGGGTPRVPLRKIRKLQNKQIALKKACRANTPQEATAALAEA